MKWTEQELSTVEANPHLDAKALSALLPGRSHDAVLQKRLRIGGHYVGKKWTAEEEQYIKDHTFDSIEEIALALNRSAETVVQKRIDLGARRVVNCTGCGVLIPKRSQHTVCKECAKPQDYWNNSIEGRYRTYKHSAKKRGYLFDLTLDQFAGFVNQPCSYCGDPIDGVGVDRIDNDAGYELENCCSCCETCNRMKRVLSLPAWLAHMQKVLTFTKGKACV